MIAATSHDGSKLNYESILPVQGATPPSVLSTTSFKIRFDRLLLPSTATRQAICLQPRLGNSVSSASCTNGVFFEPSYDPSTREITFRQTIDTAPLLPTTYELTVYVAVASTDPGIRSFDGVPLETPLRIIVDVQANGDAGTPPYDVPSNVDRYCTPPDAIACMTDPTTCPRSVMNILAGCSLVGCHLEKPDAGAAEGMELGSAMKLAMTAINVTAHETQTGEAASTAQPSSLRFGRAMPILDPTVPGESYLIYKLLANNKTPMTVPFPGASRGVDAPEQTRLRQELIVGMPMPPDNAPGAALRGPSAGAPEGEIEWLSEWLLQGAPITSTCP